ncbi:MAG: methyltransferase domain-containing protein [Acidobacteriota bacterium]
MTRVSNRWNERRYRLIAPAYDASARLLAAARAHVVGALDVEAADRVLVAGAGTGLDLPLLPHAARVTAIDLTPAMLARARRRDPGRRFALADAARLPFADASFDVVLLHLIVAVIGEPEACLREAARVTRPGGRVSVFDKFVPDGARPSLARRVVNVVASLSFSDLTRDFGRLLAASGAPLDVVSRRGVAFGDAYEAIVLTRRVSEPPRA